MVPPAIAYTRPRAATTPSPCRGVGRFGSRRQRRRARSKPYTVAIVPPGASPPTETIIVPAAAAPVPPRGVGLEGSLRQRRCGGARDSKDVGFVSDPALLPARELTRPAATGTVGS